MNPLRKKSPVMSGFLLLVCLLLVSGSFGAVDRMREQSGRITAQIAQHTDGQDVPITVPSSLDAHRVFLQCVEEAGGMRSSRTEEAVRRIFRCLTDTRLQWLSILCFLFPFLRLSPGPAQASRLLALLPAAADRCMIVYMHDQDGQK